MNTVTVTGWLQADPVIDHIGDLVVCELRLNVERPGPDRRTDLVIVTCFGRLAAIAAKRLGVGDLVGVTGWLRGRPVQAKDGHAKHPTDVVAERLDHLGYPQLLAMAPDAHLEAAYENRDELDEVW